MTITMQPRYVHDEAAATYLGLSRRGFRALRERGELPPAPLVGNRRMNDLRALDQWIADRADEARTAA